MVVLVPACGSDCSCMCVMWFHFILSVYQRTDGFDLSSWSQLCFSRGSAQLVLSLDLNLSLEPSTVVCVLSVNHCWITEVLLLDFSSSVIVAAEPQAPPPAPPTGPKCTTLMERQEKEEHGKQEGDKRVPITSVTEPLSSPSLPSPPSPEAAAAALICEVEAELETQSVETKSERRVEERKREVTEPPRKKPSWLEDDDLPPIMWDARPSFVQIPTNPVVFHLFTRSVNGNEQEVDIHKCSLSSHSCWFCYCFRMSRRVAFMSEDTE